MCNTPALNAYALFRVHVCQPAQVAGLLYLGCPGAQQIWAAAGLLKVALQLQSFNVQLIFHRMLLQLPSSCSHLRCSLYFIACCCRDVWRGASCSFETTGWRGVPADHVGAIAENHLDCRWCLWRELGLLEQLGAAAKLHDPQLELPAACGNSIWRTSKYWFNGFWRCKCTQAPVMGLRAAAHVQLSSVRL